MLLIRTQNLSALDANKGTYYEQTLTRSQSVMLLTTIREVPDSTLGPDIYILDSSFPWFSPG
jgi:hypothetical protein